MPDRPLDTSAQERFAPTLNALLLFGVVVGVCLTGAGLVDTDRSQPPGLPADAAARVNDRIITRDLVDRVVRDVAEKRNVAVDETLRRSVVAGLVDEELLVQRGIALGLPRVDRRVRSGLTRVGIEQIMAAQNQTPPSDTDLRAFVDAHPEIFAPAAKLRLRQIVFRIGASAADAALRRAQKAAERLRADEDFAAVRTQEGDAELASLPDVLLTRAKLLDYVGPTVVQAAAALAPGVWSAPILSGNAYHLVQVQARDTSSLPELARVRDQALREYQRQAGDQWLRATLDRLRADADVTLHD